MRKKTVVSCLPLAVELYSGDQQASVSDAATSRRAERANLHGGWGWWICVDFRGTFVWISLANLGWITPDGKLGTGCGSYTQIAQR